MRFKIFNYPDSVGKIIKYNNKENSVMDLKNLTLHEKVCQMMVVKANPVKHIKQYGSIKNFMEKYPVGRIYTLPPCMALGSVGG